MRIYVWASEAIVCLTIIVHFLLATNGCGAALDHLSTEQVSGTAHSGHSPTLGHAALAALIADIRCARENLYKSKSHIAGRTTDSIVHLDGCFRYQPAHSYYRNLLKISLPDG